MARYTFGDDGEAVARLRLVSEAYRPYSAAFVAAHVAAGDGTVVDLGCGPGFSTQLLSEVCRPRRLVGLDTSASFVDAARRRVPGAEFAVHDARVTPLPVSPADVLYARLLLAHLPDPEAVARRWLTELRPGGVLLVEDLERVDAPPGPLRHYEELSARIVRAGGGSMYAGHRLEPLGGDCVAVEVPAAVAAEIYLFNVGRWLDECPAGVDRGSLVALADGLRGVEDGDGGTVSWHVRQLAVAGG